VSGRKKFANGASDTHAQRTRSTDGRGLHNRRSFVDAPEVENRRCLVRLWLAGEPQSLAVTPSRRSRTDCVREHAALLTTAG
jgi:hypothetical protein